MNGSAKQILEELDSWLENAKQSKNHKNDKPWDEM